MRYLRAIGTMNNTAWQKARKKVGLRAARIHDLRHTYASRLCAAGVDYEDRASLLGHACRSMPELYASPDIKRLLALSNRVLERLRTITIVRVANGGAEDPGLWINVSDHRPEGARRAVGDIRAKGRAVAQLMLRGAGCHSRIVPVTTLVRYRITSSARSKIDSGMVSRRALAVLKLTVNLKLAACSTGRSLGLAPFSRRSTK